MGGAVNNYRAAEEERKPLPQRLYSKPLAREDPPITHCSQPRRIFVKLHRNATLFCVLCFFFLIPWRFALKYSNLNRVAFSSFVLLILILCRVSYIIHRMCALFRVLRRDTNNYDLLMHFIWEINDSSMVWNETRSPKTGLFPGWRWHHGRRLSFRFLRTNIKTRFCCKLLWRQTIISK